MEERIELLKAMNTVILSMSDRRAKLCWQCIFPYRSNDSDYAELANNDKEYEFAVEMFRDIQKVYR